MSSSSEEDDLPCLSPIEDTGILRTLASSEHVPGISFAQLVKDKQRENERDQIHQELRDFRLDGLLDEEEEEGEGVGQCSQENRAVPREVLAYGTKYLGQPRTLPVLICPDEVLELIPPGTEPDLLVLLPWGPILKDFFESPAHYQVWMFSLVCMHPDVEVSKQATYLLISEYLPASNNSSYSPTCEDMAALFDDYGGVEEPEVLPLYEIPEPPTYLQNILNALKVYGCAPKHGEGSKLDNILTVIRMITRLCQDQHMTTNLDLAKTSNILSKIFDGISSFNSREIDKISYVIVSEVRDILVAPALCQVIRSGNPRCHLILEQVTLLILAKYAGITPAKEITRDMDRLQLHEILFKIVANQRTDTKEVEEFTAMCSILDYHVTQAVLTKDALSDAQAALRNLYSSINEKEDTTFSKVKTKILGIEAMVMKRVQMEDDPLSMI